MLETIISLLRQIEINAQGLPTTPGGGQLGYLALVVDATDLNSIPNSTLFHRPIHPGTFIVKIPPTETGMSTRTGLSTTTPTITATVVIQNKLITINECACIMNVKRWSKHCVNKSSKPSNLSFWKRYEIQ